MNSHVDKTQGNKRKFVANAVSQEQRGGESTFQFVDNRSAAIAQRKLQEMANNGPHAKHATQLQVLADNHSTPQQQPFVKKENRTGLPDNLKAGIENLSGMSMDHVKVHYNSSQPAQLNALAYARGADKPLIQRMPDRGTIRKEANVWKIGDYNVINSAVLEALEERGSSLAGQEREYTTERMPRGMARILFTQVDKTNAFGGPSQEELELGERKKAYKKQFASWKRYEALKSNYEAAKFVDKYYKIWESGYNKLPMCIVLHGNAELAVASLRSAEEGGFGNEWLSSLEEMKEEVGLEREGSIFGGMGTEQFASNPDSLKTYFQRVMGEVEKAWGGMEVKYKIRYIRAVFDQSKGYDWSVADHRRFMISLEKAQSGKTESIRSFISAQWIWSETNVNPFTMSPAETKTWNEWITEGYRGADSVSKKEIGARIVYAIRQWGKVSPTAPPEASSGDLESSDQEILEGLKECLPNDIAYDLALRVIAAM